MPCLSLVEESFQIVNKLSPLLALYVSDIKIIKDNYIDDAISIFSDDNCSLHDIYFKDNLKNNNYDDNKDNFDVNSYLNNEDNEHINYSELSNEFWNRIALALNQINFGKTFRDPTKDFPNFIKSLFNIKEQLNPVSKYINSVSRQDQSFTLKSCLNSIIKLISCYSMNSHPNFIIWDLPEALYNNDYIYFSLLLELIESHNSIWVNFSKTPGSLNLFLDHYLPIIGPSNDSATTLLISIIDSIFQTPEYYEELKKPKKNANFFWFKLMRIIGCSKNVETITTAFCISKSLFLQMTPHFKKQAKLEYLDNLIDASSNGTTNSYREFYKITSDYIKKETNKYRKSPYFQKEFDENKIVFPYRYCPVHYQVLEFIFSLNASGFKYMTLCKKLINQGIKSSNDLLYIQRCLLVPKTKKPLLGFRYLLTVATSDKIWSSVAVRLLYEPLLKFSDSDEIQSLFSQFIKKAFIFVGVTTIKNKYKRRRMMIISTFQSLYNDLEIKWLNEIIVKYYAALVFSKKIVHIIPEISLTVSKKEKKQKKIIESSDDSQIQNQETESNDSIKSSHSVQSFHSVHSEFPFIPSSNSAFELDGIDQKDKKNSPKIKERVQYDKNFPNEIDRAVKSQTDMKNYLKFSKLTDSKFQSAATKLAINRRNPPKINQKLTPQQQKIQIEKQKLNDRLQQQRKQMLLNYQQQKEKKIPNSPKDYFLAKDKKKPGVNQLLNQQNQFLHIKATPQSQLNPTKRPQPKKPPAPTLIQPSKRQILNQQQKKIQKMEIKKIESNKKCKEEEKAQIKKEEEEKEEVIEDIDDYEVENSNIEEEDNDDDNDDDNPDDGNISSDDIDYDIIFSTDDEGSINGDRPNIINNDFPKNQDKSSTNVKSPNDSPPLSPNSISSISSHGSLIVLPKAKKKHL